jgi:hypothetical protein
MQLREALTEARVQQFPPVSAASVLSPNTTVPSKNKRAKVSRTRNSVLKRRKKKSKENDESKVVLPPPRSPIPPRMQVQPLSIVTSNFSLGIIIKELLQTIIFPPFI